MLKQKITKAVAIVFMLVSLSPVFALATDFSSSNFIIKDPVIDGGLKTSSSGTFSVGQSAGQTAIGSSTSAGFKLWSGFQYFFKVSSNTLTATAGSGQVSLSWTVPQTYLGMTVSSYEVGTGTTSGTYTFESVGSTTSFIKTGLTSGTPYFFKVKAKGPGGIFLVFSNEATATPTGGAPTTGGGGGTIGGAVVSLSGLAYPNSQITVLRDGGQVVSVRADSAGLFSANVSGLAQGYYNLVLFATDSTGLASSLLSVPVTVGSSNQAIAGLVISPTIATSPFQAKKGDTVAVFGEASRNSQISISLKDKAGLLATVTSDGSGKFSYLLSTSSLEFGDYYVQAASKAASFNQSGLSRPVLFKVGDSIISGPPTVSPCGDFNRDGRVNLVDFSILLYWFDKENPISSVDCNKDNRINIVDFSILMYNWTG
jgi:hypothetical protein